MSKKTEKISKQLETLYGLAYDTEAKIELVNAKTNETMIPAPCAIKAGFLAGLVAAGTIVDNVASGTEPHIEEAYKAAMIDAGANYVHLILAKHSDSDEVCNG